MWRWKNNTDLYFIWKMFFFQLWWLSYINNNHNMLENKNINTNQINNLEDLPDSFLDISDWNSSACSSGSRGVLAQQPIVERAVRDFCCNFLLIVTLRDGGVHQSDSHSRSHSSLLPPSSQLASAEIKIRNKCRKYLLLTCRGGEVALPGCVVRCISRALTNITCTSLYNSAHGFHLSISRDFRLRYPGEWV